MHVFVSSTSVDLREDCRPAIIQTLNVYNAGTQIQEEFVYDDYTSDAVTYCLGKIEHPTTHYIGLFAHRY